MRNLKCFKIAFVILFISIMSCNDDQFLEENPSTFYTIDNIFSSSVQVDQVLVSIYSHIRDLWVNPVESAWIFDFRGKGTDMYDVPSIRKSSIFSDYSTINPNHSTFYEVFSTFYYIISRSNLAIYAAELPQITWGSNAEKSYALAQARFFRAFAYRNLAELYGGVPIVTEITTSARFDYERPTRVATYQYAIDELLAIVNDLPETTSSGGRIVKGAAYHNLCQLYLAMGTQFEQEGKTNDAKTAFTKSIENANKVIDGGTYSLMNTRFGKRAGVQSVSFPVYKNGVFSTANVVDTVQAKTNVYWDLFQEGNVNYQDGNRECIWAAQIDYAAFKAEDAKSKLNYMRTFGPVFRDAAKTWFAGTLEDVGGRGISRVIPTMYARDEIYAGKWAEDIRNSEIVMRRRFKANMTASTLYRQVVPWELLYNQSTNEITNRNNRSLVYPISCKISTDMYTGIADGQLRDNLFRDDYIIRVSETILLRAEAKQRNGDKSGAAADINLLRDRAQCNYRVTAADMDDSFNTILDERARELVYEECRWNTLLRMGGTTAVDRIRKYAYWPETSATLNFNYNLWPIPQTVIDTNKDIVIDQNEGWKNR
jgi:starch-binding outer membrane protein, SusD/RagB family